VDAEVLRRKTFCQLFSTVWATLANKSYKRWGNNVVPSQWEFRLQEWPFFRLHQWDM